MAVDRDGSRQNIALAVGADGEKVFTIVPSKKIRFSVSNPNAESFDVIGYMLSAEEAAQRSLISRIKAVIQTGVTALNFTTGLDGGFVEFGVEFSAPTTVSVFHMEISQPLN